MCILFAYNGSNDVDSDYSLIIISNRDELYDRASQNMAAWDEDQSIIGGWDLQAECNNGTWLAVSLKNKKFGALLNLPGNTKDNAKSRGKIVADFIKYEKSTKDYIENINTYAKECNGFLFVVAEFGNFFPSIYTFTNVTGHLETHTNSYHGFGNSLPNSPLKKVKEGTEELYKICEKRKKISMKKQLIEELTKLLKSQQRHFPDPILEKRSNFYKELSSIFVCIPEGRYGTRTHTLFLLSKSGKLDLIEMTMQPPIDPEKPLWKKTELQFTVSLV